MIFMGTATKDSEPRCASHPGERVGFTGDACYKCRIAGVTSHARLGVRWWIALSITVVAFGVFFFAVGMSR